MSFFLRRSDETLRLAALFVFAIAAMCGLLDMAHAYVSLRSHLANPSQAQPPIRYVLYSVVLFWVTYAALVPSVLLLIDRYRLDLRNWRRRLVIHAAAAMAFAYLHTSLSAILNPWQWHEHASPQISKLVTLNFPIDFLAYWAIVGVAYALHYYFDSQKRELAASQLQASLAETRLRSLRAQLNPHFLFNTLNAISALALKGEGKAVAQALSRLAGLLKVDLDDHFPQITTLARELRLVDDYLQIQRLLLGDRLVVERNIQPEAMSAWVPSMMLQPLVENAIIHGAPGYPAFARVSIEAQKQDDVLRLRVSDSGPGFRNITQCKGIGLENTEARLKHHYGARQSIEYGSSAEGGACVTISIPFVNEAAGSPLLQESFSS